MHALWIELGSSKKRPLLVCTIYRPPDAGCQFFDNLSVMLETANKECKEILVMGDLNINYLSDCSSTRRMQSLSDEASLTQMITEPTRVTQNSTTLIDHIYASNPGSFFESGCLDAGVSDHLLVFTVRVDGHPHGHKTKTVRAFGKCNNESLLEDLQSASWETDSSDINVRWNQWKEVFFGVLDKHAPIISCRVRRNPLPWIDLHIRKLMRRRNKLRKLANETASEEAWRNYRTLRNKVTLNLRRGKRAYFESLVSKSSTTTRDVWKQLNRLLGRNKGAGSAVNLEHGDNIASRLSDHFSGSAATVPPPDQPPTIPQYSSSFHFNCITEEDVLCALSKLDPSKATGADALSARILRTTAPAISSSLCKLFNYSLKTSQIPTEWKAANVIPVPKSVNARSVDEYRPISILPVVAKVFESLVHTQVYGYLKHHDILHESQSGFRPKHSTQDALLKTVDDWRQSLDRNEIVGSVFIDLSKAFDSVCHTLLLGKLARYGFGGDSVLWFQDYLLGRRQRVVIGGEASEWTDVSAGVPQGSILGPLLFSVFVNDLPSALHKCKVMMYADDTTVYYSHLNCLEVQDVLTEELHHLSSWISRNGLRMNLRKTQFMCLSRKGREKEAMKLEVQVDNQVLERHDAVKYLGVIVDKQLNWRRHIESVRRKCLSALAVLYRVKRALPPRLRKLLYQSIVLPHLDYCAVVWTECSREDATTLERVQKRGMRFILDEDYGCPSASMRLRLGWMTLHNRRRMQRVVCTRRCLRGMGPNYMKRMFATNESLGLRSARRPNDLHLKPCKTNWLSRSFAYCAGQDWNSLPLSIRDASDTTFKSALKQYFIDHDLGLNH